MTDLETTDPAYYRFWADEHVRFADLDMLGHVNNKSFATYYETVRTEYMRLRGLWDTKDSGLAVVRVEIDYLKEIGYPATLRVGLRLLRLGRSSATMACAIFDGDVCTSTSISVVVRFNPALHKSQAFSEAERAVLEPDL